MDLKTWCAAERGRTSLLAAGLRLPVSFVSQMASGQRPVPVKHCPGIELVTLGAVRRWDLRPDDWQQIWPDLVGSEGAPSPVDGPSPEADTASVSSHHATLPAVTASPAALTAPATPVTRGNRASDPTGRAVERTPQEGGPTWPEVERRRNPPEVPGSGAVTRRRNPDVRAPEKAL